MGFFSAVLRLVARARAEEGRSAYRPIDMLPAMNGRDSYGVPAGFAGISGFLTQPPYFSGGLRRGFYFRAIRP